MRREHLGDFLRALSGADFMGSWMPEQQDTYRMYNKEFYWSGADTFFKAPNNRNADWTTADRDMLPFYEKIMIPVRQYCSERRGDLNLLGSKATTLSWYKPCEEMFSKLHLRYLRGSNCQFVNASGELICFDSQEALGDESGFFIRQDKLTEFLQECGYSFVWTSLCEKRVLSSDDERVDLPPKAIHMSSVYHLKDDEIEQISQESKEDQLFY